VRAYWWVPVRELQGDFLQPTDNSLVLRHNEQTNAQAEERAMEQLRQHWHALERFLEEADRVNATQERIFPELGMIIATKVCWDGMKMYRTSSPTAARAHGPSQAGLYATGLCGNRSLLFKNGTAVLGTEVVRHLYGSSQPVSAHLPLFHYFYPYMPRPEVHEMRSYQHRFCAMPLPDDPEMVWQPGHDNNAVEWIEGLYAISDEHHENVGHLNRDVQFVAQWMAFTRFSSDAYLQRVAPSGVLWVTRHGWGSSEHAETITRGIFEAQWGLNVLRDPRTRKCFSAIAQKAVKDPGTAQSRTILRQAALNYCNLSADATHLRPHYVLLVHRNSTHRWLANEERVVRDLKELSRRHGLDLIVKDFATLSFCAQVRLLSESAVVVAAHGAFLGNAPYMHPRAVVAELFYLASEDDSADPTLAGTAGSLVSQGQPYVLVNITRTTCHPSTAKAKWIQGSCGLYVPSELTKAIEYMLTTADDGREHRRAPRPISPFSHLFSQLWPPPPPARTPPVPRPYPASEAHFTPHIAKATGARLAPSPSLRYISPVSCS
jgi:hypothetical protein